jgi:hypothetical protein
MTSCITSLLLDQNQLYLIGHLNSRKNMQTTPEGMATILEGRSIGYSKQKTTSIYVNVSYSEWFPK